MYERQKAYRKRRAEKQAAMEQVLREVRDILSKSEKPWAVRIKAMIAEVLGDGG